MDAELRQYERSSHTSAALRNSPSSVDNGMKTHLQTHGQFSLHKILSKFGCVPFSYLTSSSKNFSFDIPSGGAYISSPPRNVKSRPSPSLPLMGSSDPSGSPPDFFEEIEAKDISNSTLSSDTFKQHSSLSLHSGMSRGQHHSQRSPYPYGTPGSLHSSADVAAIDATGIAEEDDLFHSMPLHTQSHVKCHIQQSHYASLCNAVQWLHRPHLSDDADYRHITSILSSQSLLVSMDVCLTPALKDALHYMATKAIKHYMPCRECEAPRQHAFNQLRTLLKKSMAAQLFVHGDFALKTYTLPHSPVEACLFVSKTHEPQWMRRLVSCLVTGKAEEEEEAHNNVMHGDPQVSASALAAINPYTTSIASAAAIVGGEMRSQLSHILVRMPSGSPEGHHFTPASIELGWSSLRVAICCNDVGVLCEAALTQAVGEMRDGQALKGGIMLVQLWAAAHGVLRPDQGPGVTPINKPQCPCGHTHSAPAPSAGVAPSVASHGLSDGSSVHSLSAHDSVLGVSGMGMEPLGMSSLDMGVGNDVPGSTVKSKRSHALMGLSPLLPSPGTLAGGVGGTSHPMYSSEALSVLTGSSGRVCAPAALSGGVCGTLDDVYPAHPHASHAPSHTSQPLSQTASNAYSHSSVALTSFPRTHTHASACMDTCDAVSSTTAATRHGCAGAAAASIGASHSCASSLSKHACHSHGCGSTPSPHFTPSNHNVLSPTVLRVLCLYVANAYYAQIRSPLALLLKLVEVLGSMDWRRHALTIYGPVCRTALREGLMKPATDSPCAWPKGVVPLITDDVLASHLVNKSTSAAYGAFLVTGDSEKSESAKESKREEDVGDLEGRDCVRMETSDVAEKPHQRGVLPSRVQICPRDAMVIVDPCDPTLNVARDIDRHGASIVCDAARTTLAALRHTLASTFAEVDEQGKKMVKTKRYDVGLRGFVSGHDSDSDSDNEDEEIASVNQLSVGTSHGHSTRMALFPGTNTATDNDGADVSGSSGQSSTADALNSSGHSSHGFSTSGQGSDGQRRLPLSSMSSSSSRSHALSLSPPPKHLVDDICYRILACILPAQALECVCMCGSAPPQPHAGLLSHTHTSMSSTSTATLATSTASTTAAPSTSPNTRVLQPRAVDSSLQNTPVLATPTPSPTPSADDAAVTDVTAPVPDDTTIAASNTAISAHTHTDAASKAPSFASTPPTTSPSAASGPHTTPAARRDSMHSARSSSPLRSIYMPGVGYVRLLSGLTSVTSVVTALVERPVSSTTSISPAAVTTCGAGAGAGAGVAACQCDWETLRAIAETHYNTLHTTATPTTSTSTSPYVPTNDTADQASASPPNSTPCPCGGALLVRGYVYGYTRSGRPKLSVTAPPAVAAVTAAAANAGAHAALSVAHGSGSSGSTDANPNASTVMSSILSSHHHSSDAEALAPPTSSPLSLSSLYRPDSPSPSPRRPSDACARTSCGSTQPLSEADAEAMLMDTHLCGSDCDGVACAVTYESLAVSVREARHFSTPDISPDALVNLVISILKEKGPVPIGRMGSLLHVYTNNHSLPATLKETYGGLKRFLEKHRDKFVVGSDHPYNPHVYLSDHMSTHMQGSAQPEKKKRDKKTKEEKKKMDGASTGAHAAAGTGIGYTVEISGNTSPQPALSKRNLNSPSNPPTLLPITVTDCSHTASVPYEPYSSNTTSDRYLHPLSALTHARAQPAQERKTKSLLDLSPAPMYQPTNILADIAQCLGSGGGVSTVGSHGGLGLSVGGGVLSCVNSNNSPRNLLTSYNSTNSTTNGSNDNGGGGSGGSGSSPSPYLHPARGSSSMTGLSPRHGLGGAAGTGLGGMGGVSPRHTVNAVTMGLGLLSGHINSDGQIGGNGLTSTQCGEGGSGDVSGSDGANSLLTVPNMGLAGSSNSSNNSNGNGLATHGSLGKDGKDSGLPVTPRNVSSLSLSALANNGDSSPFPLSSSSSPFPSPSPFPTSSSTSPFASATHAPYLTATNAGMWDLGLSLPSTTNTLNTGMGALNTNTSPNTNTNGVSTVLGGHTASKSVMHTLGLPSHNSAANGSGGGGSGNNNSGNSGNIGGGNSNKHQDIHTHTGSGQAHMPSVSQGNATHQSNSTYTSHGNMHASTHNNGNGNNVSGHGYVNDTVRPNTLHALNPAMFTSNPVGGNADGEYGGFSQQYNSRQTQMHMNAPQLESNALSLLNNMKNLTLNTHNNTNNTSMSRIPDNTLLQPEVQALLMNLRHQNPQSYLTLQHQLQQLTAMQPQKHQQQQQQQQSSLQAVLNNNMHSMGTDMPDASLLHAFAPKLAANMMNSGNMSNSLGTDGTNFIHAHTNTINTSNFSSLTHTDMGNSGANSMGPNALSSPNTNIHNSALSHGLPFFNMSLTGEGMSQLPTPSTTSTHPTHTPYAAQMHSNAGNSDAHSLLPPSCFQPSGGVGGGSSGGPGSHMRGQGVSHGGSMGMGMGECVGMGGNMLPGVLSNGMGGVQHVMNAHTLNPQHLTNNHNNSAGSGSGSSHGNGSGNGNSGGTGMSAMMGANMLHNHMNMTNSNSNNNPGLSMYLNNIPILATLNNMLASNTLSMPHHAHNAHNTHNHTFPDRNGMFADPSQMGYAPQTRASSLSSMQDGVDREREMMGADRDMGVGMGIGMGMGMGMPSGTEYGHSDTSSLHSGHSGHSGGGNSAMGLGLGGSSGGASTQLLSDQHSMYSFATSTRSAYSHGSSSMGGSVHAHNSGNGGRYGFSGAASSHEHESGAGEGGSDYGVGEGEDKKKKKRVRKPKMRTETPW